MALTNSELLACLADPKKARKNRVLVRTAPSVLEWVDGTGLSKGQFEGKVGTKKRGRKGNITTMPNGRRDYVDNGNWWDESSPQVVAY